jgi:hypothetical protein
MANMCFKVYGYVGPHQALEFLQDFKLGHYMKIPPRAMFTAQVSSTSHTNYKYYTNKRMITTCSSYIYNVVHIGK